MKGYSSLKRAGTLSVLAILLMTTWLVPRAVSASSPVAMSGSFYAQKFEIPVGGVVRNSSVYVVVFNQGTKAVAFVVGYAAPTDVTLDLSETEFVLDPGQSKEVLVAVLVGANAVPGSYQITVNVEALGGGSGIELLGAAEQGASLRIVREAGDVHVETVSLGGERLSSHVRLWKIVDGNEYEFAESVTGVLDATVSPGSYVVKAFSTGVELASQEFDVADQNQKSLTLTVEPIYFKSFDVVLENGSTEETSHAQVLYTIANVYRPVSETSVDLVVMLDGAHLETIPAILTMSALNTGDTVESYSYVPSAGWENGTYSYRLELYVGGELYASTRDVTPGTGATTQRGWLWVVWPVVGILCIAALGSLTFFVSKRRKKRHERLARKA